MVVHSTLLRAFNEPMVDGSVSQVVCRRLQNISCRVFLLPKREYGRLGYYSRLHKVYLKASTGRLNRMPASPHYILR